MIASITGLADGVSASAGTGIHGGSSPSRHRPRPDLCGELGHPGETYNPWAQRTWCLCGLISRPGNDAGHESCCCGGRLVTCLHDHN